MIITIANAKGGVAKTTTAMFLAAAMIRRFEKHVTVLDADPQGSASLWLDMIESSGESVEGLRVVAANASTLQRAAREKNSLILVDAPPQGRLLATALEVADFVMVPTSDSPLDWQQAHATLMDIPQGTPAAVLVVRAEPQTTSCKRLLDQLESNQIPCFETIVRKRQALKSSLGSAPMKLYEYADVLSELVEVLPQLAVNQ